MIITGNEQRALGTQLRGIISGLSSDANLGNAQGAFYGLGPRAQANRFSDPVWDLAKIAAPEARKANPNSPLSKSGVSPVIIGTKEGIDGTIVLDETGNVITVNLEQGGLATNTSLALQYFHQHSHLLTLLGSGERRTLHRHILESTHGLDVSNSIDTLADSALHVCIKDAKGTEYWFAPDGKRGCYNPNEIGDFTQAVFNCITNNQGAPVILTSIPPQAAGDSFFTTVVDHARQHSSPSFLNMKQFDPNEGYLRDIFKNGSIDFIKPNLMEFAQLVRYSGLNLIQNTDEAEIALEKSLRSQIAQGNFSNIENLAKKILLYLPTTTLFISFGEKGAMAINNKHTVICSAPKITPNCTTGAGDSGLAAMICEAKIQSFNLFNLGDPELQALLTAFNAEAAATCSLPGSQLGKPKLYAELKPQVQRIK